jgi:plasmid maintenance system antidote protein VapI
LKRQRIKLDRPPLHAEEILLEELSKPIGITRKRYRVMKMGENILDEVVTSHAS